MLTAIAAVALTWCESSPEKALIVAANELGTDTDTIATMAGAILGPLTDADPPVDVLDTELFRSEAQRMSDIAAGLNVSGHAYPDLLHWSPPRTRADSLSLSGRRASSCTWNGRCRSTRAARYRGGRESSNGSGSELTLDKPS